MLTLVIVLVVTNLATLGVLAYLYLGPADGPRPDTAASDALNRTPRPPAVPGGTRRLISIEILNPIELAGTKGRIAGIAGSLVPGLTRRIVYDQTLKILKQQLVDQQVVADVRLHTLRPVQQRPVPQRPVHQRPVQQQPVQQQPVGQAGRRERDADPGRSDPAARVERSARPAGSRPTGAGERDGTPVDLVRHRSARQRRRDHPHRVDRGDVAYTDDVQHVDLAKIEQDGPKQDPGLD
ncbi:MAG: hypothetical protein ACR2LX_17790 [Jatrophihabitans sp.]